MRWDYTELKYWTCAYCHCQLWMWILVEPVFLSSLQAHTHTNTHARTHDTYSLAITLLLALARENKIMRKVYHLWNSVIWEDKIAEYVWTVMISKKGISPVFSKIKFFQGSNCTNQALFTVEILCPKMQLSLKNWTSKLRCYIGRLCDIEVFSCSRVKF